MNPIDLKKTVLRVALYLRLSDEDRDKLTRDQISKSIQNQELMLREYAKNDGYKIVVKVESAR